MKNLKPYRLVMTIGMAVMGAATLCLLVMACMQVFGKWDLWASVPVFTIVLMALLAAVMVGGMFGRKLSLNMIGNYALHAGLAVFLLGGLIYNLTGTYVNVQVPVRVNATYSQIQRENGEILELGFSFGMFGFKVERYAPAYDVYVKKADGSSEIVLHDVSADADGYFRFGEYGRKHRNDLISSGGAPASQLYLTEDGRVVALCKMPVKYYEGDMAFVTGSTRESRKISVNHPVRYAGWKIYLMSYDEVNNAVNLAFKQDPGEAVCLTGIILAMLGAFWQCIFAQFLRPKPMAPPGKSAAKAAAQAKSAPKAASGGKAPAKNASSGKGGGR